MLPFFSIVIPTYNRIQLLINTIDSFNKQTFKNFEIVIVDDGSTDNTEEIIRELNNPLIKYFKKENEERCIARNYGVEKSSGKVINFFDSDDLALPNHLEVAYSFFQSNHQAEIVHLGYEVLNNNLVKIASMPKILNDSINQTLLIHNPLSCNGVFLTNDLAKKYPFPHSKTFILMEDYYLWLKIACNHKFYSINTITSSIIHHDTRTTKSIDINKFENAFLEFETNINLLTTNCIIIKENKKAILSNANLFIGYLFSNVNKLKYKSFKLLLIAFKLSPINFLKNKLSFVVAKNILIK